MLSDTSSLLSTEAVATILSNRLSSQGRMGLPEAASIRTSTITFDRPPPPAAAGQAAAAIPTIATAETRATEASTETMVITKTTK